MGLIHHITLTVSLIWAVLFRVYPAVADSVFTSASNVQTTVLRDTHKTHPIPDSAVFLVQDEDEQTSLRVNADFLPSLPVALPGLLMVLVLLQPILRVSVAKRLGLSRPYYLLFCSLRIPSI
ncbi:hypothetical protein [Larkinella sp.]|uniref:hypothetical protein n=1 Tax=Larkinella sp. TaxID=2034517 RepID=UPI003BA95CA3